VTVDGVLYATVSKTPGPRWSGPFRGLKLLMSPDNGKTWSRVDRRGQTRRYSGPEDPARNEVTPEEMFFLEEFGLPHQKQMAYPFSYVAFVHCGRDNSLAKDDFLYIYSPEGAQSCKLLLARVPKQQLGIRAAWEYFVGYDETGRPEWSISFMFRESFCLALFLRFTLLRHSVSICANCWPRTSLLSHRTMFPVLISLNCPTRDRTSLEMTLYVNGGIFLLKCLESFFKFLKLLLFFGVHNI